MALTKYMKHRIDELARVIVQMRRGEFEYDENARGVRKYERDASGELVPAVNVAYAIRHVFGYTSNSLRIELFHSDTEKSRYLKQRIEHHEMAKRGGVAKEIAECEARGHSIIKLVDRLYDSLMADLEDEESARKISFRDRAALYEKLTKHLIAAHSDVRATYADRPKIGTIINNINVPDSVRKQMEEKLGMLVEGEATEE